MMRTKTVLGVYVLIDFIVDEEDRAYERILSRLERGLYLYQIGRGHRCWDKARHG